MRKLGLWGGGAVLLLLALGVAAAPAASPRDDDDEDAKPTGPAPWPRDGWNPALARLFGQSDKKPAPKPDKDKEKDKKADEPAPRPAESAARLRALEEAKLRRRQDVCLRLREIAREAHDDALERKALELDGLAWEIYLEHTRRLPAVASDAEAADGRASGDDSGSTAGVREVRP
jgi:hypothetical protein